MKFVLIYPRTVVLAYSSTLSLLGTVFAEEFDEFGVAFFFCHCERGFALFLFCIQVSTFGKKEFDCLFTILPTRIVKRCPQPLVFCIHAGTFVDQQSCHIYMAVFSSYVQSRNSGVVYCIDVGALRYEDLRRLLMPL